MLEQYNGTVVQFKPVPKPGRYPYFVCNDTDWNFWYVPKPGPQPVNPEPLLTLVNRASTTYGLVSLVIMNKTCSGYI